MLASQRGGKSTGKHSVSFNIYWTFVFWWEFRVLFYSHKIKNPVAVDKVGQSIMWAIKIGEEERDLMWCGAQCSVQFQWWIMSQHPQNGLLSISSMTWLSPWPSMQCTVPSRCLICCPVLVSLALNTSHHPPRHPPVRSWVNINIFLFAWLWLRSQFDSIPPVCPCMIQMAGWATQWQVGPSCLALVLPPSCLLQHFTTRHHLLIITDKLRPDTATTATITTTTTTALSFFPVVSELGGIITGLGRQQCYSVRSWWKYGGGGRGGGGEVSGCPDQRFPHSTGPLDTQQLPGSTFTLRYAV